MGKSKSQEEAPEEQAKVSTSEPSPETANPLSAPEGYELVNWTFGPRIQAGKHGTVDLRRLSQSRAEQLVRSGFKYLRKK